MLLVTGARGLVGGRVLHLAQRLPLTSRVCGVVRSLGDDEPVAADLFACDLARLNAPGAIDLGSGAVPWHEVTTVIHCAAAIPARTDAATAAARFAEDNVNATRGLLRALRDSPLRAFVFLSSVSVYATDVEGLDEDAPLATTGAYALSKRASEELVRDAAVDRGFAASILRPSSVYGPRMHTTTLLPALVTSARAGAPIVLFGPRGHTQNFVHVDDVATLALHAAREGSHGTFNVFSDDTFTVRALAELVRDALSPAGAPSPIDDRTDDTPVAARSFPNGRSKAALGARYRSLADSFAEIP